MLTAHNKTISLNINAIQGESWSLSQPAWESLVHSWCHWLLQDAKAAEKAAKKAKAAAKKIERDAQEAAGPTDKQQKAKDEAEAKKVHNTRTV